MAAAQAIFDDLLEELILQEVCLPLHRRLRRGALCLHCAGEQPCADGWEAPPLGNRDFECRLANAVQHRLSQLADESVSREAGLDVFGTKPRTVAIDNFKCSHCGKKVSAHRFAPHLERCMMGGGRVSARIADNVHTGKEPSPIKRNGNTDARASPQNMFPVSALTDNFIEGAFDPSLFGSEDQDIPL